MLGTVNLDGDGQADLVGHGGIHKAAYALLGRELRVLEACAWSDGLRLRAVWGELHRRGDDGG